MSPRRRDAEQARAAILEAARRLFAERDLAAVSRKSDQAGRRKAYAGAAQMGKRCRSDNALGLTRQLSNFSNPVRHREWGEHV